MKKTYYILNHETLKIKTVITEERFVVDNVKVFDNLLKADKMRNYLDTYIEYN